MPLSREASYYLQFKHQLLSITWSVYLLNTKVHMEALLSSLSILEEDILQR